LLFVAILFVFVVVVDVIPVCCLLFVICNLLVDVIAVWCLILFCCLLVLIICIRFLLFVVQSLLFVSGLLMSSFYLATIVCCETFVFRLMLFDVSCFPVFFSLFVCNDIHFRISHDHCFNLQHCIAFV
jgi:hypothetical protein